jgi:predicted ArsR family transcriptional regulator
VQSTKQQILVLLKRTGSATVEEAAGALSVASMTARQHLVGLERDGLVESEKVRRATGRPHYLYKLTPKGDEVFPRRYDVLAQLLLDEVGALDGGDISALTPAEKRSLLVQRTADRLAERHRLSLSGRSLAERVAGATELLHAVGGFAEWYQTAAGFEIRDYNCIFSRIATNLENGCEWHIRLLTRLLDHPISHEVFSNGAVRCCRYLINPVSITAAPLAGAAAQAATDRTPSAGATAKAATE